MKISVFARPHFRLTIESELVEIMTKCSQMHYDAVCRRASQVGGFIYGWQNMLNLSKSSTIEVSLSWVDLDLTLKILEVLNYSNYGEELTTSSNKVIEVGVAYIMLVSRAFAVARELRWESPIMEPIKVEGGEEQS